MDKPVTLPEMLAAREDRFALRRAFFRGESEGVSLLQVTVNMPGPVKNSDRIRHIFDTCMMLIGRAFPSAGVLPESSRDKNSGPEGFVSLCEPAREIKKSVCRLEEESPLGRLWDIDVFITPVASVSRRDIGLDERKCFLCGDSAHACARSGKHPLEEILCYIDTLYREFA